jgi:hypothetical protein
MAQASLAEGKEIEIRLVGGKKPKQEDILCDKDRDVQKNEDKRSGPLGTKGRVPHVSTVTKHRLKLVRAMELFNALFDQKQAGARGRA